MTLPFSGNPAFSPATALDATTLDSIRDAKQRALASITPPRDEVLRAERLTETVIDAIRNALTRHDVPFVFIEPQGSTGIKQTQLAGDFDVDLFIGLDPSIVASQPRLSKKEIRAALKERFTAWIQEGLVPSLEASLHPEALVFSYAEHPYLTVHHAGMKFDVVFCLALTSEAIEASDVLTAMDRTPLHSKFVRDALDESQRGEVRLLKAFFKAQHVYGDKSPVGQMGFIGYALEILVHYFGTMENVLVNLRSLPDVPVDVFQRPPDHVLGNPRFKNDMIFIVDPTDRHRNVGSSMDPRCFHHACRVVDTFLARPATSFFEAAPLPATPNEDPRVVAATLANAGEVHYTIVRDKCYKLANFMRSRLERERTGEERFGDVHFSVVLDGETTVGLAFACQHHEIPATYTRTGPAEQDDKSRLRRFLDKNPGARLDPSGRYLVIEQRDCTRAREAIETLLASSLDITGVSPAGERVEVAVNPGDDTGKRAIHVLKTMILPVVGQVENTLQRVSRR